jgi:hypothetical protein
MGCAKSKLSPIQQDINFSLITKNTNLFASALNTASKEDLDIVYDHDTAYNLIAAAYTHKYDKETIKQFCSILKNYTKMFTSQCESPRPRRYFIVSDDMLFLYTAYEDSTWLILQEITNRAVDINDDDFYDKPLSCILIELYRIVKDKEIISNILTELFPSNACGVLAARGELTFAI